MVDGDKSMKTGVIDLCLEVDNWMQIIANRVELNIARPLRLFQQENGDVKNCTRTAGEG